MKIGKMRTVKLLSKRPARGCAAAALAGFFALLAGPLYGGNREMVEQEIQTLDRLNKQAVGQLGDKIPADGQIELKAKVFQTDGEPEIHIQHYRILSPKDGVIRFDRSQQFNQSEQQEGLPDEGSPD